MYGTNKLNRQTNTNKQNWLIDKKKYFIIMLIKEQNKQTNKTVDRKTNKQTNE